MTKTQFAITLPRNQARILAFDEDIAEAIRDLAEEHGKEYEFVSFPNGILVAVGDYEGRTAGEDAEVETEEEYDTMPILYADLV